MTEFHADDYGLFPAQSRRILACCRYGVLNGISVITNSANLTECMDILRPYMGRLQIAVHLNFMEGYSLSDPKQVDMLTDQNGKFTVSFGRLVLASYLFARNKYRQQFRREIRAQIQALLPYLDGRKLRIDSHAHYHMVPVVFDALMDVIHEENLEVEYIRIPRERISLYWTHRKELTALRPINLLKVLVLNAFSKRNLRKYKCDLNEWKKNLFIGVLYSGRMCEQNLKALLPDAEWLVAQKGSYLEILAHPGGVYEEADIRGLTNSADIAFLTSVFREQEAKAFAALKEYMPDAH